MEISIPDSPHFRNIIAIVFGLMVSAIAVGTIEMLGHQIYPELADLDYEDDAQMRTILSNAPATALVCIIAAWTCGNFFGCFVAGVMGTEQGTFCCIVLSVIIAFLAVTMLSQIPMPKWFTFLGLVMLIPGGFAGWWLSRFTLDKLQSSVIDK